MLFLFPSLNILIVELTSFIYITKEKRDCQVNPLSLLKLDMASVIVCRSGFEAIDTRDNLVRHVTQAETADREKHGYGGGIVTGQAYVRQVMF